MSIATLGREVHAEAAPDDPRRAMLALARVEAVRLLRHPVTVAGILLFVLPMVYGWVSGTANSFPILQDEDSAPQFIGMLVLGGGAFIAANLATLRAHRHATTAMYDTLVLPAPWRTGGFLLAVLPFAGLVALLVAVRIGILALLPGAAGRPDVYELVLLPVVVLLLGVAGVLLARLARSVILAPLLLLGLTVVTFAVALPTIPGASWARWLTPVAIEDPPMPVPVDLMSRPAGRHLAYVAGLAVLIAVAAVVATGARSRRILAAGVAGLSVAVVAGATQFLPVPDRVLAARTTATDRPADQQTCRRIDQVGYCAFDDFAPWIDGWDAVLRGVLRGVPDEQAQQPLTVRQRLSLKDTRAGGNVTTAEEQAADVAAWQRIEAAAGTPDAITVGTRWGDGLSEFNFAGQVAYRVVTRAGPPAGLPVCGARGVLVAWLAGQAGPEATGGLHEMDENSWGGVPVGDMLFPVGLTVPDREMTVALALLKRPAADVAKTVKASWAELSAKGTSADRAGEMFGVAVPPLPPENERIVCE
jgi:hypothetical protein